MSTPDRFQRLLYMSELPPSTMAGAPVIARRLLSEYDLDRLEVLCCERQHDVPDPVVRASYLDCEHTVVGNAQRWELRPRRYFGPFWESLNLARVPRIRSLARRIVRERRIEAILTVPWRADFALAAYLVSRETGLPLYVFEMDDWESMNARWLPRLVTRRYHGRVLRHAEKVWLISPPMIDRYRERFGVEGHFLHHHVDLEPYLRASAAREPFADPSRLRIVYTGSVNRMFADTMVSVCGAINAGLRVDGRRVELSLYGASCPPELLGPHVTFEGLVPSDRIPEVLAAADVLLVAVTFSQEQDLLDLVKTSVFTKTVEYLAANRPVLIVSPRYAAQVDYFGSVATVVDSPEPASLARALAQLAGDAEGRRRRSSSGLELIRAHHSADAVFENFLGCFQRSATSVRGSAISSPSVR
jgi:glycosyltransferase involved in cell wall biosynthesis